MKNEDWAELMIELYTTGYNHGRDDEEHWEKFPIPLEIAGAVKEIYLRVIGEADTIT